MSIAVYIQLGSNLGNRQGYLRSAFSTLSKHHRRIAHSRIYESSPWGFESDRRFLNMVCCMETLLDAHALLDQLLAIEMSLGRMRQEGSSGYVSRTIDLDILLYGNAVISDERLHIPHPLLTARRFALEPLCEISPDLKHPVNGLTVRTLLKRCDDRNQVTVYASTL